MPNKADLDTLRTKVSQALTATGKTYTWSRVPVAVGSFVDNRDILELRAATDLAYDNIKTGCSSHNAVVNSSNHSY